jgi:alkylation response protein AidB-like acyl-CoA dehydrogenase
MRGFTVDTDEGHELLRDAVRRTIAPFGYEYFAATSRAGGNPTELWRALGDAGYLGVHIPTDFGGGGAGIAELAIVTEEVAANGSPLMLLALSPAVCATMLIHHGSPEQQQEWLPSLASGARILAFAITEPDAGSNTRRIRLSARQDGSDWVLSGSKYYVSHVDNADAMIVVARTGTDATTGAAELSLFIVPTDAPGLERAPIEVDLLSPERQFTIFLDEVRVPGSALVGEVGRGMQAVFTGLNPERIGSAAVVNGISRYLSDRATDYARTRQVWDVPIGAHQAIAHPLARAHVYVELARLATDRAARLFDTGADPRGEQANLAKFAAAEAAGLMLDAAIQTHGGNGMAREYGIAAMWGLVRLFRIAPVSSEMVLNHIAQHSLGLPRSY